MCRVFATTLPVSLNPHDVEILVFVCRVTKSFVPAVPAVPPVILPPESLQIQSVDFEILNPPPLLLLPRETEDFGEHSILKDLPIALEILDIGERRVVPPLTRFSPSSVDRLFLRMILPRVKGSNFWNMSGISTRPIFRRDDFRESQELLGS